MVTYLKDYLGKIKLFFLDLGSLYIFHLEPGLTLNS